MALTLNELAGKIGARILRGDPNMFIDAAANLAEAGPTSIAPFTDLAYADELAKTRAGAVLSKLDAPAGLPQSAALLQSSDPELAFIGAIEALHPARLETPGVDARACVEPGVELGQGVHIGPFALIRSGTRIGARSVIKAHAVIGRDCVVGEDCTIHPRVVFYDNVHLGKRVTIHAGAVLGADGFGYKFRGGRHVKVPQVGCVKLGDDVEIGANACIDRGALGATSVGDGTKIDNLVQIGHNVSIGKHCILCGQAAIAGSSGMDDYAMLGGNAGIGDKAFMGKGSKAGAKAGIMKDVAPGEVVFGYPAEERKSAFRQVAALRRLPQLFERVRALEKLLEKQNDS